MKSSRQVKNLIRNMAKQKDNDCLAISIDMSKLQPETLEFSCDILYNKFRVKAQESPCHISGKL